MIDLQLVKLPELECVTKNTGRRYETPEGKWYPSVTTVIGYCPPGEVSGLDEWRARVGEEEADRICKTAAERGTAVHDMAEQYIKYKEVEISNPYYKMFWALKYKLDNIGTVVGMETPLYSDTLGLAGRVDCVGDYRGTRCIIDFKTATKMKKKEWIIDYWLQCTAYAVMWYERTGEKIDKLLILMVDESGNVKEFCSNRREWMEPLQERILEYRKHVS